MFRVLRDGGIVDGIGGRVWGDLLLFLVVGGEMSGIADMKDHVDFVV